MSTSFRQASWGPLVASTIAYVAAIAAAWVSLPRYMGWHLVRYLVCQP